MFSAPEDIDPVSYTLGRISPVKSRGGNKQTETERGKMQRTRLGFEPGPPESTQRKMPPRELTPGLSGDLEMVEVTLSSPTEIASLEELGRKANKLANAKIGYEK
jgi:hypothetical protein